MRVSSIVCTAAILAVCAQARGVDEVLWVDIGTSCSSDCDGSTFLKAIKELPDAIRAASPPTQLWVVAGTYKPTTGTTRTVSIELVDDVKIYGGFDGTEEELGEPDLAANVTILSGDIGAGDADSYRVVDGSGVLSSAELHDLTITGGFADGNSPNNQGGGMYNSGGDPTIVNCIFTGNTDSDGGSPDESSQIHDATDNGIDVPTYCDIQGLTSAWDGINDHNIGDDETCDPDCDDPLFRDSANDNLRVAFSSRVVDFGLNTAIPDDDADIDDDDIMDEELPFDLDSNNRKEDGIDSGTTVTVDMGAYETCELLELGDTDANGEVDCDDYCYIEDKIGCTVGDGDCTCDVADVDDDGDVDSADLTATGLSGCTPCPYRNVSLGY